MNVYEDEVELPNGLKTSYIHFGKHHDASQVIAVRDDGKILLQREYSYPPNEWLYQFPGGMVDAGETHEDAAHRELAEEANTGGTIEFIGKFYADNRRKPDQFYVYVARELTDNPGQLDPEEDIESYWFTESEIDQLVRTGKLINYSVLSAWALYKAWRHAE